MDRAFFGAWVPKIRAAARAAGVPAFEIFGEVFETDAAMLASFVRERGVPNVIDFPLQDALARYAGGSAGARGISTRLGDDDYFRLGDGVAPTPVTFLGNHDVGRAALKIKEQGGGEGAELLARDLLGHSLLYLLRGAPAVFYGDEVGMIGRGGDKAARQDIFPTGGGRMADRGAGGLSADRHRLVVRRRRASGRRAPARARGAARCASRALDRGVVRPARTRGGARGQPDRPRRAARVPRRVQRGRGAAAMVTVQTATPSSAWSSLLGTGTATASARERPARRFGSRRCPPRSSAREARRSRDAARRA